MKSEIKDHWDALIAAVPSTIAAIAATFAVVLGRKNKRTIDQVSINIDGKMQELLAAAHRSSHLEGRQDERDIQEGRQDTKDAEVRQDAKDERERQ